MTSLLLEVCHSLTQKYHMAELRSQSTNFTLETRWHYIKCLSTYHQNSGCWSKAVYLAMSCCTSHSHAQKYTLWITQITLFLNSQLVSSVSTQECLWDHTEFLWAACSGLSPKEHFSSFLDVSCQVHSLGQFWNQNWLCNWLNDLATLVTWTSEFWISSLFVYQN